MELKNFPTKNQSILKIQYYKTFKIIFKTQKKLFCSKIKIQFYMNNYTPNPKYSDPSQNTRIKTQLCQNYENTGNCKFNDLSQFAHGQSELRTKFVPKPCFIFFKNGKCQKKNCNYSHDRSILKRNSNDENFNARDINSKGSK